MHTPAKGAGLNKGLGGSNPPFSASIKKGRKRLTFSPFFESGCRITAITLAFQARDEGSTPFTRSRLKKALQL